ncbi:MAG: DUF4252 domain-containing protein [Alistipes sp.]|nr:DUF4252 domain-containing protein [Alistipes sp.]
MKKLFLLIILIIGALQGEAYAQTFDEVVKKFEDKKGAEVIKLPGVLMKMALAFVNEEDNEGMPREAMEFLKHISSMSYLDMSECSSADKQAFATAMKSLTIDDFEAIDTENIETARLFFHKGKKKNQMIMASYEGDNYSLTLMTGRFDEALAAMYATASKDKEEKK